MIRIALITILISCFSCINSHKESNTLTSKELHEISTNEIQNLLGLIEIYKLKYGKKPESLNDLISKKMIDSHPMDAWGSKFIYNVNNKSHFGYELISPGEDRIISADDIRLPTPQR